MVNGKKLCLQTLRFANQLGCLTWLQQRRQQAMLSSLPNERQLQLEQPEARSVRTELSFSLLDDFAHHASADGATAFAHSEA